DGIRFLIVTGVQTCALPISLLIAASARFVIADARRVRLRISDRGRSRSTPGGGMTIWLVAVIGRQDAGLALACRRFARQQKLVRSEERRVGKECRARGARWY